MKRTALGMIAMLAVAAPASAQQFLNFDNYCNFGAFQLCASVRLESEDDVLTMKVWNLETLDGTMGTPHTITAIGLYHSSGTPWTGTVEDYLVTYEDGTPDDITDFWTDSGTGINHAGSVLVELKEGATGNHNGINGCTVLDPNTVKKPKWQTCSTLSNNYVQLKFDLSSNFDLNGVELVWRSQQVGPRQELSQKCDTGGNLVQDYGPCEGPPTVVPEPITMVLLGSGLGGIAAIRSRRRRKDDDQV